jgi:hypothetical protein
MIKNAKKNSEVVSVGSKQSKLKASNTFEHLMMK